MSRLKEIFSQRPERMSSIVKWTFGLPLAYICYFAVSLILPNVQTSANAVMIAQMLRSLVLAVCVLFIVKVFLKFDLRKLLNEEKKWNHISGIKGFVLMLVALVVTNISLALIFPGRIQKVEISDGRILNWFCSLLLIVVSGFSEELIFRAYIAWFSKSGSENEFLATNKRKILVFVLASACLFTIAHFSNPEVEKSALWSMLFYFIFGFCLMLFFFKTKGIEFGFGIHLANNLFTAWILNYKDSVLPTQSLFVSSIPVSFITILQAVLCLLFCAFLCPEK